MTCGMACTETHLISLRIVEAWAAEIGKTPSGPDIYEKIRPRIHWKVCFSDFVTVAALNVGSLLWREIEVSFLK